MRITIDDVQKTIEVNQDIKLSDLISKLETLFPDGSWKEYALRQQVIQFQSQPYNPIVPYTPPFDPYSPYNPWGTIVVTDCGGTGGITSNIPTFTTTYSN